MFVDMQTGSDQTSNFIDETGDSASHQFTIPFTV